MAATKRNAMNHEEARKKIQTTQLINRLQGHVLKNVDMSKSQVGAALGLLKKTLPDMQYHQVGGDPENPLQVESKSDLEIARAIAFALSKGMNAST